MITPRAHATSPHNCALVEAPVHRPATRVHVCAPRLPRVQITLLFRMLAQSEDASAGVGTQVLPMMFMCLSGITGDIDWSFLSLDGDDCGRIALAYDTSASGHAPLLWAQHSVSELLQGIDKRGVVASLPPPTVAAQWPYTPNCAHCAPFKRRSRARNAFL